MMSHLYIHIPFCVRRCHYCDFLSYTGAFDLLDAYVDAVCGELSMLANTHTHTNDKPRSLPLLPLSSFGDAYHSPQLRPTIFIGGGTPNVLTLPQCERVVTAALRYIAQQTTLPGKLEISIEINPGILMRHTHSMLHTMQSLRALGINRVSIGVQSLDDELLRLLGRIHTAHDAATCYHAARNAGFERINVDLLFGIPGQTVTQWEHTVQTILAWQPDHIALYSLILEPQTPLARRIAHNEIAHPDEDIAATMYERTIEILAAAGYHHYEISNWARADVADTYDSSGVPPAWHIATTCHHNVAYWLNDDYLGVGAGAHGHLYPYRYVNEHHLERYIAMVANGTLPLAEVQPLTHATLCAETMFMGLRLNAGVANEHFRARCGEHLTTRYGDILQQCVNRGLLVVDAAGVRFTARGRMVGNVVFEQFV